MTHENFQCAYCGGVASEWDHLRPLVKDKKPTGYISEIHNLVPSCGKCNQSKGNKEWKTWMLSTARLSPTARGIKDISARVKRLEAYENSRLRQNGFFSHRGTESLGAAPRQSGAIQSLMRESRNSLQRSMLRLLVHTSALTRHSSSLSSVAGRCAINRHAACREYLRVFIASLRPVDWWLLRCSWVRLRGSKLVASHHDLNRLTGA